MRTSMKTRAKTYSLPDATTPEYLEECWSTTLNFGNKILMAGYYWNGPGKPTYFGATYEFTTDDHSCEGEIRLTAVSEVEFEDNGHAISWAMNA